MSVKATECEAFFSAIVLRRAGFFATIGQRLNVFHKRPERGVWTWTCVTRLVGPRIAALQPKLDDGSLTPDDCVSLFSDRPPYFVAAALWKLHFPSDGRDASIHALPNHYITKSQVACVFNFTPASMDDHACRIVAIQSDASVSEATLEELADRYMLGGCLISGLRTPAFDQAALDMARVAHYFDAEDRNRMLANTVPDAHESLNRLKPFLEISQQEEAKAHIERVFQSERGRCMECKAERPTQQCSACHAVRYCNAACQRTNWPVHRRLCDSMRALSAALDKKKADA